MQSLDESRIIGIVSQCRAQPFYGGIEAVLEVDERACRPQPLAQLFSCNHLARPIEHHRQDFEWLILQADPDAALPQLTRARIDLKASESDHDRQVKVNRLRGGADGA